MKITISGKNIDVTEGLKAAVNEKLGKLEKYFTPDTNVIVTLSVEKERQKIEVTIPVKGNIIRSEQVSNDMYVSIDLVEEVIERQLRKYKNKIADKQQEAGNFQKEYLEHDYLEDEDIQIIRTKKFGMKPMYPEAAETDHTTCGKVTSCCNDTSGNTKCDYQTETHSCKNISKVVCCYEVWSCDSCEYDKANHDDDNTIICHNLFKA